MKKIISKKEFVKSLQVIAMVILFVLLNICMYTYVCNVNGFKYMDNQYIITNKEIKSMNVLQGFFKEKKYKNFNQSKKHCVIYMKKNIIKELMKEVKKDEKIFGVFSNNIWDFMIKKLCVIQFNIDRNILKIINGIYGNAKYFPIAHLESVEGSYPFENSWSAKRTYGGERTHEGTDIMYSKNKDNVVPIVSISDGVIEKKGWLELGGYRLLVRVNDNVTYYYAHLASYASNIKEGMKVKEGQLLGYMGSTGYGKEGTKGKFDTHLHFGIYYDEIGINPYFLLEMLKISKLSYK